MLAYSILTKTRANFTGWMPVVAHKNQTDAILCTDGFSRDKLQFDNNFFRQLVSISSQSWHSKVWHDIWTRTLGKNQQNTGSDKYIFLKKMKKSAFIKVLLMQRGRVKCANNFLYLNTNKQYHKSLPIYHLASANLPPLDRELCIKIEKC